MTKSDDKNLNILRMEKAFKMKKNIFFIIFNGLSMKQITQIFLEGESLTLKCSQWKLFFHSQFSILQWHIAPLVSIFSQGLHITCRTYYNLSIKAEI